MNAVPAVPITLKTTCTISLSFERIWPFFKLAKSCQIFWLFTDEQLCSSSPRWIFQALHGPCCIGGSSTEHLIVDMLLLTSSHRSRWLTKGLRWSLGKMWGRCCVYRKKVIPGSLTGWAVRLRLADLFMDMWFMWVLNDYDIITYLEDHPS